MLNQQLVWKEQRGLWVPLPDYSQPQIVLPLILGI
jgi:hypothetical protein